MTKFKTVYFYLVISLMILNSACNPFTTLSADSNPADTQPEPINNTIETDQENTPAENGDQAIVMPETENNSVEEASETEPTPGNAAGSGRIAQGQKVIVQGWLGHVESLPAGAQFDDQLVLMNDQAETLGINGSSDEINQEIITLRDREEPGKYAHFWGELVCDVIDVNGCQLVVSRIRVGAVESQPEPVNDWEGTITIGTFNGGKTFIFNLNSKFSMQYAITATGEASQAILETAVAENAIVRVSGTLITGIPDGNGSRIIPDSIEIIGYAPKTIPEGEENGESGNWLTYTNENYGYQVQIPDYAVLTELSAQTFPPAELPQGTEVNQYMQELINNYGSNLCVRIEVGLAYLSISGSANTNYKYGNCGRINLPKEFTQTTETLTIAGQEYTSKGYLFGTADQSLKNQGETYHLILADGTLIEYGSVSREDASFSDYQMKGAQTIREILLTFTHLD